MKLTEKERRVYAAFQSNGLRSADDAAKRIGFRPHTVRRLLSNMARRNIVKPYSWINGGALGFQKHRFYFSIATNNAARRKTAENFFVNEKRVVHLCQLAGKHEYLATLATRSDLELSRILHQANQISGGLIVSKAVAIQIRVELHHRRYISPPLSGDSAKLVLEPVGPVAELNEKDHQILDAIERIGHPDVARIAVMLQMPQTTIRYRIAQLESRKLIAGYVLGFDPASVGLSSFTLLITTRGFGLRSRDEFLSFCELHPAVVLVVEVVGAWDLELLVELPSPVDLRQVIQDIYQRFNEEIQSIESLTVIREVKDRYYAAP